MTPGPDTVVVFRIPLDRTPAAIHLDEREQRAADRFVFEKDRRCYVAAHTAVRVVLGRCLGMPPRDLRFAFGFRGKPRLANAPVDLRFNLSHAADRALLAVTIGREVGVDIERMKAMPDMSSVAAAMFSPAEIERLEAAPAEMKLEVFFRIWTRKESFIKAHGDGLYFPLAGFDVSTETAGDQLLLSCEAAPKEMERWTLRALSSEAGYAAAITVEGRGFEIVAVDH